jgi:hypothetical protein
VYCIFNHARAAHLIAQMLMAHKFKNLLSRAAQVSRVGQTVHINCMTLVKTIEFFPAETSVHV